jgi:methylmalonyl-CoA mutase cobalamin-binding domain/chain
MDCTLELARARGTVGEWAETIENATNGRYVPPILDRNLAVGRFQVPALARKTPHRARESGTRRRINAVKLLAYACMQAGMEVTLAGFKQTPVQLAEGALPEDADVRETAYRQVLELLKQHRATDIKVAVGGIIPEPDRKRLLDLAVSAVFTPSDLI